MTPTKCWHHCPGKENPADIPSREMTPSELRGNRLWRHGSDWLVGFIKETQELDIPEACLKELKIAQPKETLTLFNSSESTGLSVVMYN